MRLLTTSGVQRLYLAAMGLSIKLYTSHHAHVELISFGLVIPWDIEALDALE